MPTTSESPHRCPPRPRQSTCPGKLGGRALARALTCLAVVVIAGLMTGCGEPAPLVAELSGSTMGTTYSVKLSPPPDTATGERLQQQIEQRLEAINRQMSTYVPDSDLSRFNDSPSTAWQSVPAALASLTDRALLIGQHSGGVYDVTVGPLVDLWGFGSEGRRDTPPAAARIAERLAVVGAEHLQVRQKPPAIRKSVGGVRIDLSSIAKGWAVDRIGELLSGSGIDNYLVEIGGEVLTRGEKTPGTPWAVAVESPLVGRRQPFRVVALRDMAMATSGDYRNFFDSGGRRYSHTIDPRTGQAFQHRLASVTVIADQCADADAWATALMAAGDVAAPALAERYALKALFLIRDGDGFREQHSRALNASGLIGTAD